jgi:hypothetical protein
MIPHIRDAHGPSHDNEHIASLDSGGHGPPAIELLNVHLKPALAAQIGNVSRPLSVHVLENDGLSHGVLLVVIR